MNAARRTAVALATACALVHGQTLAADDQSLFDPVNYKSLVAEEKAYRVGDVLTVIVQESATATSAADSRAQRKTGIAGEVGSSKVGTHSVSGSFGTDNDGGGRTQRSGRLLATVTVRVTEVSANGDLIVRGEQLVSINGEDQSITLSGTVRPRDVGENNTVASSRIADARIAFNGEGFIADKSKPGWISRLFSLLGF
jgi:flagellar L-ring protein FlgH